LLPKREKTKPKPKPKKFKMRLCIAQSNLNFLRKGSQATPRALPQQKENLFPLQNSLCSITNSEERERERASERASEKRGKQGEQRALLRYVEDKGQLTPLD
jgi:hypothetical protein